MPQPHQEAEHEHEPTEEEQVERGVPAQVQAEEEWPGVVDRLLSLGPARDATGKVALAEDHPFQGGLHSEGQHDHVDGGQPHADPGDDAHHGRDDRDR